jgi:hypothetical protein
MNEHENNNNESQSTKDEKKVSIIAMIYIWGVIGLTLIGMSHGFWSALGTGIIWPIALIMYIVHPTMFFWLQ